MTPAEFFADHTFRMVFLGTSVIGLVAGALGAFAYLRKQSLISDVISHAALPGTLGAFLLAVVVLGVDGRSMLGLIAGAVVAGVAAVLFANGIARTSVVRIDAAMAISLTTFFGLGMLLMRVVANGSFPGKGGIQDYLFGNASTITIPDLVTSVAVGGAALVVTIVFWKEFALRTFDPDQADVLGFRGRTIDLLMFTTVVVATVIGVKAVGLVLMVAFVVTPPAAARQWTTTLRGTVILSGAIGAVGSGLGAYLSIALGRVPTGPLIVLALFGVLVVSLLASPRRSIVVRAVARARGRRALRRELAAEELASRPNGRGAATASATPGGGEAR
ncbi:metal ABC transporter permease [Microbacterium sp. gxy059]|uniref:metal ABC transporter permease n=1 Tax=Microbacterium sp. gxy059 TaxID=2957199 RepID=UPI003D96EE98